MKTSLSWRRRLLVTLLSLAAGAASVEARESLLSLSNIADSYGVVREQRLVDGIVPAPESPIDDFVATLFLDPQAYVGFDLGREVPVAAVQLVSADDSVLVETSATGEDYQELELAEVGRSGKMLIRAASEVDRDVRFLRLALRPGRQRGAVGEFLAFRRTPRGFPARLEAQEPPTYARTVERLLAREHRISRAMFVLAGVAIALLLLAFRLGDRKRWLLCLLVATLSLAGWFRLGTFQGGGRVLHAWDLTHYYLGSKYFPELGYTELYRCLAAWERQQGRGVLVDQASVRNLDDNVAYRGGWTNTPGGTCRSQFTSDRWPEFGGDADQLRRQFVFRRLHDVLKDHGYNATPLQTSMLWGLGGWRPPRPGQLSLLALLDFAALAGAVWALWWGLGPIAGAAGSVLIGFGDPWAYTWTGGSMGRHVWLLALCLGLAHLAKRRWLTGFFLVTVSGMLRLFPLLLLAGPAAWVLRSLLRRREKRKVALVSVGVVAAVLVGVAIPTLLYGGDVHQAFFANSRLHAQVPSTNFMGLGVLVSAGLEKSALSPAPESATLTWRRVGWLAGILAAAAWLLWAVKEERDLWQTIPLAAPLVFAAIPLSCYDYVWMLILIPLAVSSRAHLAMLLGFAALSNLLQEVVPEGRPTYAILSLGVLILLVAFCIGRRAAPPSAAEGSPEPVSE